MGAVVLGARINTNKLDVAGPFNKGRELGGSMEEAPSVTAEISKAEPEDSCLPYVDCERELRPVLFLHR